MVYVKTFFQQVRTATDAQKIKFFQPFADLFRRDEHPTSKVYKYFATGDGRV